MKARNLIIFGIYVAVFTIIVMYVTFPNPNLQIVTRTTSEKIVNVDGKKLFDLMTDVEKYPQILPENVVSVHIVNRTNNIIFAEDVVQEAGIKTKLMVKHTIIPYGQHVVEVLSGDANGTKISVIFDEMGSQTKLETTVELHLKGILLPFAYLPADNIQHAMNTVLDHFVSYLK